VSKRLTNADLTGSPNKILKEILDVPTTLPLWVEDEIRSILSKYEGESDNEGKAEKILEELKSLGLNNSLSEFLEK
jgi:DNA-directed RNA polymerase subunit F